MEVIEEIINIINNTLDKALPYAALLVLVTAAAIYGFKAIRKGGVAKGLYLLIIFAIQEGLVVVIFWFIPKWLSEWLSQPFIEPLLRWLELYIGFTGGIYILSREYGGRRGLYSALGHLSVILMGWLLDRWVGIIFISFLILAAYSYALYNIAVVIIPASDPEDRKERWRRFVVFLSYAWGIQYPLRVVTDPAGRKIEERIKGDFTRNIGIPGQDIGIPGLVWTRSCQPVGITAGVLFRRVDGPGVAFTGYLERPLEVVDLRTQLRSSEIEAVSRDGIPFKAIVFTAFAVDGEKWPQDLYDRLRQANPSLRGGKEPDYTLGSYPFSRARVRAVLSTTGVRASSSESDSPEVHWDDWVLSQVEKAARQVLSQRDLDALWRPQPDTPGASALKEIADQIRDSVAPILQASGIRLYTARIVNFIFSKEEKKDDEIPLQQIATWGTEWERQRAQTLAEGEAEAERLQQDARAYARSVLLTSVAEELKKVRELHKELPRYVIALRFVEALQDLIREQPEGSDRENEELSVYVRDLKRRILSDIS